MTSPPGTAPAGHPWSHDVPATGMPRRPRRRGRPGPVADPAPGRRPRPGTRGPRVPGRPGPGGEVPGSGPGWSHDRPAAGPPGCGTAGASRPSPQPGMSAADPGRAPYGPGGYPPGYPAPPGPGNASPARPTFLARPRARSGSARPGRRTRSQRTRSRPRPGQRMRRPRAASPGGTAAPGPGFGPGYAARHGHAPGPGNAPARVPIWSRTGPRLFPRPRDLRPAPGYPSPGPGSWLPVWPSVMLPVPVMAVRQAPPRGPVSGLRHLLASRRTRHRGITRAVPRRPGPDRACHPATTRRAASPCLPGRAVVGPLRLASTQLPIHLVRAPAAGLGATRPVPAVRRLATVPLDTPVPATRRQIPVRPATARPVTAGQAMPGRPADSASFDGGYAPVIRAEDLPTPTVGPARPPGSGRRAESPGPSSGEPADASPPDVYVYREDEDPVARSSEGNAAYWYDDVGNETAPAPDAGTRGPFEPLVSSSDPPLPPAPPRPLPNRPDLTAPRTRDRSRPQAGADQGPVPDRPGDRGGERRQALRPSPGPAARADQRAISGSPAHPAGRRSSAGAAPPPPPEGAEVAAEPPGW